MSVCVCVWGRWWEDKSSQCGKYIVYATGGNIKLFPVVKCRDSAVYVCTSSLVVPVEGSDVHGPGFRC